MEEVLDKPKSILFVSHDSQLFGASRSLVSLIVGLKQLGVKCHVLIPRPGPLTELLQHNEITYSIVRYTWWIDFTQQNGFANKVRQKLKNARLFYRTLKAAYRASSFVKEQNFDIIYSNTSVIIFGALLALLSKRKHVWHIREFVHQTGWAFPSNSLFRFLLNSTTKEIIFTSFALYQGYHKYVSARNYHIVYNGIFFREELAARKAAKESYLRSNKSDCFIFSIIGDINPNKRQEQAIRALAIVANKHKAAKVRLLIVGGGSSPEIEILKKLAVTLEVSDRVTFCGYVKDTLPIYLQSDVIVVCSKYESFGRVAVEAMATLTPVIGYNSTGTAEIIEDHVTGLLYNGDYIDLADKMQLLLHDDELCDKLTSEGWMSVARRFDIESYSTKIYQLLK